MQAPSKRLIQRLRRKSQLLKRGDPRHERIRTVLVITGGGSLAAGGHGAIAALHKHGLGNAFDVVVGTSGGAIVAACHLSGPDHATKASLFWETLVPQVINYDPLPRVDLGPVKVALGGLHTGVIRQHRSGLYVGLTRKEDGLHVLRDAKPDVASAILASAAIPGLCADSIRYQDTDYYDGGVSDPLPIGMIVESFEPTDILIIANWHSSVVEGRKSLVEWVIMPTLLKMRRVPERIQQLVHNRHRLFRPSLEHLETLRKIHWGIIWPPPGYDDMLMRDPKGIRALIEGSLKNTQRLFDPTGNPAR